MKEEQMHTGKQSVLCDSYKKGCINKTISIQELIAAVNHGSLLGALLLFSDQQSTHLIIPRSLDGGG